MDQERQNHSEQLTPLEAAFIKKLKQVAKYELQEENAKTEHPSQNVTQQSSSSKNSTSSAPAEQACKQVNVEEDHRIIIIPKLLEQFSIQGDFTKLNPEDIKHCYQSSFSLIAKGIALTKKNISKLLIKIISIGHDCPYLRINILNASCLAYTSLWILYNEFSYCNQSINNEHDAALEAFYLSIGLNKTYCPVAAKKIIWMFQQEGADNQKMRDRDAYIFCYGNEAAIAEMYEIIHRKKNSTEDLKRLYSYCEVLQNDNKGKAKKNALAISRDDINTISDFRAFLCDKRYKPVTNLILVSTAWVNVILPGRYQFRAGANKQLLMLPEEVFQIVIEPFTAQEPQSFRENLLKANAQLRQIEAADKESAEKGRG